MFQRPRFGLGQQSGDEANSWWQTISDFLAGFTQHFSAKSPFLIKDNDPIADGTLIASGFQHPRQAFEHQETIARHEIIPLSPMMVTAMRVDRRIDKTLTAYLESEELKALKSQVPLAAASPKAEMKYLRALNESTNRQFDHAGMPQWQQLEISERDTWRDYRERMDQYMEDGATGKKPTHHTSRLLGHSMRRGVGVCRHRSLLLALSVRQMNVPGLQATYTSGLVNNLLDRDSEFSTTEGTHVWNVVTVPSGRKYVVDPVNDVVLPIRKINGQKHPLSYASFEHIFKHGNPNFNRPFYTPDNSVPSDDSDSSNAPEWLSDDEFQVSSGKPKLRRVRTSLTI